MVKDEKALQEELAHGADRGSRREPVAIVGLGCRFPGADRPEAFWKLLAEGRDVITEIPAERFDIESLFDPRESIPGKTRSRWGAFLQGVDLFDAAFFQLSPREAERMDPQHRLLLEVAWEALEDAGQVPEKIAGSSAGVFVGMCYNDYEDLQFSDWKKIDLYANTGGVRSAASGRLSFAFDLQGPSVSIDTACSSSLVAVHLALQSLERGESEMALAAGVNLVLQPEFSLGFSQANMLSADGRCKFASADADGFVRSEGVGVLVLKTLSRAQADGDRIHAVIRGSAVANDGRSSGQLMTPGREGQEVVLRTAYRDARVSPAEIDYIEAHGTGTRVGDPVELEALASVLGKGRSADQKCRVGSVKSNIGHTEGAAGLAGLIKVALALGKGQLPASLHCDTLNPAISWEGFPLEVQRRLGPWPERPHPRRAGVSSFGIAGTNAHVVLEEAPPAAAAAPPAAAGRLHLLPLSARSPEALRSMAERYVGFLRGESAPPPIDDLCFTAAVRRTHHDHRLAVWGVDHEELASQLESFLAGAVRPGLVSGRVQPVKPGRLVFVFPGQGSQWLGMGRQLMVEEPVFRKAIERCEEAMRPYVSWSLTGQLEADELSSRLGEVDVIQPMIFAMQVALAELWRSWGVEPAAVVGQSLGEVAASCVAGALSLEDAARVICRRSQIVRQARRQGAMAVVDLSLEDTRIEIGGAEDRLSVAVSSSPHSTVVSGDADAVEELLERLEARDVFCRTIKVDYASHSPHMEALRDDLLASLEGLNPRSASVPMYSTVTAEPTDGAEFDEHYWVRNLREPVLFDPAVQGLVADGHDLFLEISPHPIVVGAIRQTLQHLDQGGEALSSLRREEDERAMLLHTLASLYTSGYPLDWECFHGPGRRCVSLPAYPFERRRFWSEWAKVKRPGEARSEAGEISHPLLGRSFVPAAQPGTRYWRHRLSVEALSYLADHRVQGAVMVPAAAYVEMALGAGRSFFGTQTGLELEAMEFKKALFLDAEEPCHLQVVISPNRPGTASVQVFGEADPNTQEWILHASGVLRQRDSEKEDSSDSAGRVTPDDVRRRSTIELLRPAYYEQMARRGLEYGPSFQGIEAAWISDGEAIARLALGAHLNVNAPVYSLHPVLLDSCLQVLAGALPGDGDTTYVPVHLEGLRIVGEPADAVWAHARLAAESVAGAEFLSGDVRVLDASGRALVEIRGLGLRRLSGAARPGVEASEAEDWLYEIAWQPKPAPETREPAESTRTRLLLSDGGTLGETLAEQLKAAGEKCITVVPGERFRAVCEDRFEIDPTKPAHFRQLVDEVIRGAEPACGEVVHLWSLSAPLAAEAASANLEAAQELGAISATYLVQALVEGNLEESPRLWLVTRGAQPAAGSDSRGFAQSPIWGLGRVVGYEHPELKCRLVDLDPHEDGAERLAAELRSGDEEDQIALRGDQRYAARLRHVSSAGGTVQTMPAGDRPFRLITTGVGAFDELRLREIESVEPGPGEVKIRVEASGLNFRDVMIALGLMPPLQEGSYDLGWECAGTILAVGAGVEGLAVGDPVVGLAPGCFGTEVLTSAVLVAPKPAHLDFEEAATVPIVFTTVFHALCDRGRLRSGERVLIHSAAGGVGLAAVQLAQWIGAEIFATAGSAAKRELLRSLGVRHVMDSRSLDFAGQVMEITGGEGVDVVLNSLSGEAIEKSFALLRPFGRFLEIGKTDILKDSRLGMRRFENNVSFHGIDIGQLFVTQQEEFGELQRRVLERFEKKDFRPLKRRIFPVSQTVEAFRHMARAEHVGKVVVSMRDPEVRIEPRVSSAVIERDASYLISGGLSGLGLAVARWMAKRGAGRLILTGRRGPSAETRQVLEELESEGTRMQIVQADVAEYEAMAEALRRCRSEVAPLRGVVHCAGVLDDGTLTRMDRARFETVMRPKVSGAWNLHTLTSHDPLDFFVLFSSAASLLGSPGQGNYAAANAFLDALAHFRRSQGRPGLSINWGPWSKIGLAARPDRGGRMASRGIESLSPQEGVAAFARVLELAVAGVAVMPFEAERWARFYPRARKLPFFDDLMDEASEAAAKEQTISPDGLLSLDPEERPSRLVVYLSQQISKVVGLNGGELDTQESLSRFGVDSLMAVELKNRIEADLHQAFSVVDLLKGTTIAQLVTRILERLEESAAEEAADPERSMVGLGELSADQIDELSEEELDLLLREMSQQEEVTEV